MRDAEHILSILLSVWGENEKKIKKKFFCFSIQEKIELALGAVETFRALNPIYEQSYSI